MNIQALQDKFQTLFNEENHSSFFAPGRVNLIGEHTDYNGGNVFPAAITLGTYGVATKRNDQTIRMYSENFSEKGVFTFELNDLDYKKEDHWTNYPKGMIQAIQKAGYVIDSGFDIAFWGNLPNGAGLSSSASIELLTGVVVKDLFNLEIDQLELVKLGQKVENDYIGVNSGIMDQFAVGMGRKDHAMLLDTNTLESKWLPIELPEHSLVIMNTNKRRELADSKYNERRSECEQALEELQAGGTVSSLGELSEDEFEERKELISTETLYKRAKHAVYENQRTLKAAKSLQAGDLAHFGELMNQSHISLQNDYEVTGVELDTLVHSAWNQVGVVGARMTGAGFGGCAIAIVEKDHLADFIDEVGSEYLTEIGYPADFYIADISDGAKKLEQ